jgi:hypothetical protein
MKDFKFLTKNRNIYGDMDIINISPIIYDPTTFEPVRGVTYRDENGESKFCIIGAGHPIWDEIPTRAGWYL